MWRREVIRLVLAANWCVAGLSFGMVAHGAPQQWGYTAHDLALEERREKGIAYPESTAEWKEVAPVEQKYQARTANLHHNGLTGWLMACGASLGTAVLLMIAFPKKPETTN
jgi:hypothetical protein